jgi:hypothetical protein
MTKYDFEKELDKNQLNIVKHGGIIAVIVVIFISIAMLSMKINEESIMKLIFNSLN